MGTQSITQHADLVISRLAHRQHGAVARWQLLPAGVSGRQIKRRLQNGRLVELHRGVYLAGAVPPAHAHEMAALLAYRLQAVLSHRTAAAQWRLLSYPAAAPVWVTVAPARGATRPRIKAVRAALPRGDVRRRLRMPLTAPPRTILDLAALLDDEGLERVVAEAAYRRLASERELRTQLEGHPRRHGVSRLRRVLELPGGPQRTRSSGERAMLRLLRKHRIEGFEANARIHGYEVDFLWRSERLVVEVDGYDAHAGRRAFERDRLKAAVLQAHGLLVMPVTGRQISNDDAGVAARLRAPLDCRTPPAPP